MATSESVLRLPFNESGFYRHVNPSPVRAGQIAKLVCHSGLTALSQQRALNSPDVYPKTHKELQREIGDKFLVISQVPIILYSKQDYQRNRLFFPERNITMPALTGASIIAAISQSNGTHIQSKAAIIQGRRLFFLNNCFLIPDVPWPHRFIKLGAVRAYAYNDIRAGLRDLIEVKG